MRLPYSYRLPCGETARFDEMVGYVCDLCLFRVGSPSDPGTCRGKRPEGPSPAQNALLPTAPRALR